MRLNSGSNFGTAPKAQSTWNQSFFVPGDFRQSGKIVDRPGVDRSGVPYDAEGQMSCLAVFADHLL